MCGSRNLVESVVWKQCPLSLQTIAPHSISQMASLPRVPRRKMTSNSPRCTARILSTTVSAPFNINRGHAHTWKVDSEGRTLYSFLFFIIIVFFISFLKIGITKVSLSPVRSTAINLSVLFFLRTITKYFFFYTFKKEVWKITRLVKVRFIKVNELE